MVVAHGYCGSIETAMSRRAAVDIVATGNTGGAGTSMKIFVTAKNPATATTMTERAAFGTFDTAFQGFETPALRAIRT